MSNNSNFSTSISTMMKHLTYEQIIEKVLHNVTYACNYWIQQIDTSIPLAKLNGKCVEDKWLDCLKNGGDLIITDFRHQKHTVDMWYLYDELGDFEKFQPKWFNQPNMFMKFVDTLIQITAWVNFDKYEEKEEKEKDVRQNSLESEIKEKIEEEVERLIDELNAKWKNSPNLDIAKEFERGIDEIYARHSSKNTINNKKSMNRYNAFKKRLAIRNSYQHCELQINN